MFDMTNGNALGGSGIVPQKNHVVVLVQKEKNEPHVPNFVESNFLKPKLPELLLLFYPDRSFLVLGYGKYWWWDISL